MSYEGYECLRVEAERGVAFVTIDHPPINLFDVVLMAEVDRLGRVSLCSPASVDHAPVPGYDSCAE